MSSREGLKALAHVPRQRLAALALLSTLLGAAGVSRAQTVSAPGKPAPSSSKRELSPTALKEVQAILAEKTHRTPAQRKLDSHIHFAGQVLRGAVDLSKMPSVSNSRKLLELDPEEHVHVDISAEVNGGLLDAVAALGGIVQSSNPQRHAVRAWIPLLNAERLAERPDVHFIRRAALANRMSHGVGLPTAQFTNLHPANSGVSLQERFLVGLRGIDSNLDILLTMAGLIPSAGQGSVSAPNVAGLSQSAATTAITGAGLVVGTVTFSFSSTVGPGLVISQSPAAGTAVAPGSAVNLVVSIVLVDLNGVIAEAAGEVQTDLGVTGAGVKIGVLSDGVDSLAAKQAAGELPSNLTVLSGQAGSGDEGTAMLEIVYDMAPDAQLFFADGFGGEDTLADNIQALANAGCQIIVSDTFYIQEAVFQEDFIAQAIDTVTAQGVLFFDAAGNEGNEDSVQLNATHAGTWEGDFNASGNPFSYDGGTADFNVFSDGSVYNEIVTPPVGSLYTNLAWSDPYSEACNDYDLFLFDSDGNMKDSGTNDQSCEPFDYAGEDVEPGDVGDQLAILLVTQGIGDGQIRALHLQVFDGSGIEFSTNGATVGSAGAASSITVGATSAIGLESPFVPGEPQPQPYSDDGPRTIFYNPDGSPITPGNFLFSTAPANQKIPKVNFLAADCSYTDIPAVTSLDTSGDGYFCGTSAAAPHAAAIAALVMSANGFLSPSQVESAIINNTVGADGSYTPDSVGVGIAMANLSVNSVLTPVTIASNPSDQAFTISGAQCRPSSYFTPWQKSLPVAAGNNQCIVTMPPSVSTGPGSRVKFTNWEDLSTNSTRVITIPLPAMAPTYTASYTQQQYLATVTANPAAGGTVTTTVTADSPWYNSGTAVSVAASANPGYQFSNFSGGLTGTVNPGSLSITGPESVTANFNVSLTTQVSASGGGTVSPPSGYFSAGSVVSLTATPDAGYAFGSWTGNVTNATNASTTILLNDPQTVTATFDPGLTMQIGASGGGTVSPGSGYYAPGTVVPISATPNAGYTFSGWTGNVASGGSAATTVTMNGPQTVTANFSRQLANTVPNVVGDTQAAATTAITGAGLLVGTVTTASSTTVAAGDVISESPVAGTSVAAGSSVNLVISSGPAKVSVPNVVGDTQAAATTAITSAGLIVGTVTTASSGAVPAGDVISESPVAGTSVAAGSSVNLVISSGPALVSVPNVVGDTQAAATTAITGVGLIVGTVTTASSGTVASGDVISESPVAGTSVAAGSGVNLVISSGPAKVSVPNVVGDTQAAATTAITGAGLLVGTVTTASSGTVAAGDVISESPVAGTSVAAGSSVNLVISSGPASVSVPNVVGDTQAAATTAITGAGLVVGTVTTASSGTVAAGDVISESPVAGTTVAAGSGMNLVVSTGPAALLVPNVVGDTQAAATTAITGAGLVVGTVTTASSGTVAAGNVISESPVAGTSVAAGSGVNLVISSGPAKVSVPNVVGDTQAAATTAITGAGLVVGVVTQAASTTVAAGDVISESPVAGTSVAAGSAVNLVVSLGAPVVKIVPATSNPSCAIPACIVVDGSGNYDVTLYVTNQGNVPITLASITTAKLGTAAPTSSTTIANLAAGATGSFTLTFPASAGAATSNVAFSVSGSYSASGASGNWSVGFRSVTLP
jgi:uncharacterized repeat protein (TIGR02543 family)